MNADQKKSLTRTRRELRAPVLDRVFISVPLVPPSVNHYKRPKASGKGFYVTEEAKAFKAAVAVLSKGSVEAKEYFVGVVIYLAKGQKGDAANFEKCIGDGLQDAGIIRNDSQIKKYQIEVSRDWDEPGTEIVVCALDTEPFVMVTRSSTHLGVLPSASAPRGPCKCHGALFCKQNGAG